MTKKDDYAIYGQTLIITNSFNYLLTNFFQHCLGRFPEIKGVHAEGDQSEPLADGGSTPQEFRSLPALPPPSCGNQQYTLELCRLLFSS